MSRSAATTPSPSSTPATQEVREGSPGRHRALRRRLLRQGQISIFVTNRGGRRPARQDTKPPPAAPSRHRIRSPAPPPRGTVSVIDAKTDRHPRNPRRPRALRQPSQRRRIHARRHQQPLRLRLHPRHPHAASAKTSRSPSIRKAPSAACPIAAAFAADGQTHLRRLRRQSTPSPCSNHSGHHWKVAGSLPTGWFPSAIAVDADRQLCASSTSKAPATPPRQGQLQFHASTKAR